MVRVHEYCKCICSHSSICSCLPIGLRNDVLDRNSPSACIQIRHHILQETNPSNQDELHQLVVDNHRDHIFPVNHHKCGYLCIYSAYMIYTRVVFPNNQAKLFFFFIIVAFAIKYFMLAQYSSGTDIMAKRN